MTKRVRSTKARPAKPGGGQPSAVREALANLRARLERAGAVKVLKALEGRTGDDEAAVGAVSALFVHTTLGRGLEDDIAEALARMNDGLAEATLAIGLRSRRVVLCRAAARALCLAPSRSPEVRAALETAATVSRDEELRATCERALALSR